MSAISDQLPEGGKPPMLKGNTVPSIEGLVRIKALEEQEQAYAYSWTLYMTDGEKCTYEDIITAFQDTYEFIIGESVLDNSLIGNAEAGFHIKYSDGWDGNSRDGFRRNLNIISGGLPGIHFECWIGEEWQGDPKPAARFELPIQIKTNWEWPKEKDLWQFIVQRFGKIGYQDATVSTSFKGDLLKRLENYPEEIKVIEKKSLS